MFQKKKTFIILIAFLFISLASQAVDPKIAELTQRKLPSITIPKISTIVLKNGVKIFYLKDNELPIFKLTTYFEELGSLYEKKEERGITAFFMSIWRSGGSKTIQPNEVDQKLEYVAASLTTSPQSELSSMSLNCLQKDFKDTLDLYFDILKNPGFDPERLEILKKNSLNRIKRRNEEANNIAGREFLQSLYGQDSPHAWKANPDTIGRIDQNVLNKFYDDFVAPNRMMIAGSSPLEFDEFLKVIEPYFQGWDKSLPKRPFPTHVKKEWEKSTVFIQKDGNQSAIVMGHFAEKRFNKDKFKLILADEVLGGSTFGSRLGDRIRTELGLAYSISSSFDFASDIAPFMIVTQTKSESTVKTIREIQSVLTHMVETQDISQEELNLARERIINHLIFEYDIPFNIVNMELKYNYFGYPPNYLQMFQKEIEAVTLSDVNEVLSSYFFPNKLKTMIVGDRTKIPDLDTLEGLKELPLDEE